ncbi:glycoside hydrolase family 2 TIM barrel-domain containing protein [Salinimicrobium xinjiangense]|uniref:glycoside hydrolase family 2 TIM barrel-domain containing protein n=1 Tax=Salinimicrobium xinjiangense TaxID=438596 RepID=UPI00040AB6CC|nr:glycoside hydrolase family 2 TIM barrel-domain containing protein [Salinimicrobium xinjiangense]
MLQQLKCIIFVCLTLTFFSCQPLPRSKKVGGQQQVSREVINFGNDWQFQRLETTTYQTDDWDTVFLPHTVKIEPLIVNDQWQGTSLYRKNFNVDLRENQKYFFHFEGVMQEARININDSLVRIHKGGYLPFTIDATPHLINNSENTIEVEVINIDNSTIPPGKPLADLDFNLYGGIYRNVQLIKTNEIHITDAVHAEEVNGGGKLVHFDEVSAERASGFVKVHVRNNSETAEELQIRTSLTSEEGSKMTFLTPVQNVSSGGDRHFIQEIAVEDPQLWSPDDPNLYELRVEILSGKEVLDEMSIKTGIRKIELTGTAFYLNGEELFINGTNRHQEYPYVGYAISDAANYRDAYKIKEAGFNFVRLSHYPHATSFLEACDELGLLVMNAIPGWQYYEEGEFVENALQDVKDMVRRDRNHPSVVFWENSLNESGMTDEFILKANKVLKAELPYENTFSAGWMDHPAYDLFIPARQHAKPPSYWNDYNKPDCPILIAEYGDWEYYAQNAGFNQKAFADLQEEERTSRQLRGAGEKRLLQQALNFQEATNSNLKGEQTIGMSNWLMFDYNRGYADDLEASGISDIFRIPKFSYYFYKSQKPPNSGDFSEPMVYIANYWQPNSTTDITVYSNTEEVALYLNDQLIERKKPERDAFSDELWYPPYKFSLSEFTPGELRAVGFINGKEVATHIVRTPGKASKIELSIDVSGKEIARETSDVVFVYARILDENGDLVHTAANPVTFRITGGENAELIGENPTASEVGIATILLRTKDFRDPVKIEATAEDLPSTSMVIK